MLFFYTNLKIMNNGHAHLFYYSAFFLVYNIIFQIYAFQKKYSRLFLLDKSEHYEISE